MVGTTIAGNQGTQIELRTVATGLSVSPRAGARILATRTSWLFVFPLCGFSLSLFCNYENEPNKYTVVQVRTVGAHIYKNDQTCWRTRDWGADLRTDCSVEAETCRRFPFHFTCVPLIMHVYHACKISVTIPCLAFSRALTLKPWLCAQSSQRGRDNRTPAQRCLRQCSSQHRWRMGMRRRGKPSTLVQACSHI